MKLHHEGDSSEPLLLMGQEAESPTGAPAKTGCHRVHVASPRVCRCHVTGLTESPSYLHVAAELNREAVMFHLNGLHAGLPCPGAAGTVMQQHVKALLLVVK